MPMTPSEETHAARPFRNAAVVHAVPFARWQPLDSGTPWVRCSSSSTQPTWVLQREARLPILGAGGRVSPPAEDAPEGTAVADVAAPEATAAADQTQDAQVFEVARLLFAAARGARGATEDPEAASSSGHGVA